MPMNPPVPSSPSLLIRSEFDIQFHLPCETAMVAMLHLHPVFDSALRSDDALIITSGYPLNSVQIEPESYHDSFGNRCLRFAAPAGTLRLVGNNLVEIPAQADIEPWGANLQSIATMPTEVLRFLLPSRYCEVDRFGAIAQDMFNGYLPGGNRAIAIRDWVHDRVRFDYMKARPTKTAMDVFTEREGVCRDFQHLAIALTRALNMPARYVTGHLGDIRRPYSGVGDFSAWYQVWLDGRWWDMDARHNTARFGRLLIATGQDAADVAITTSFGQADLTNFTVDSYEVDIELNRIPLPEPLFTRS